MIEKKGAKSVPVNTSTNDTKKATFALTICVDGSQLCPSVLIFKGVPTGRIVTKEFPTYPPICVYVCQNNTWMKEQCCSSGQNKSWGRTSRLHLRELSLFFCPRFVSLSHDGIGGSCHPPRFGCGGGAYHSGRLYW